MDIQTTEKLVKSLTGESIALLPHLPYLLQDLWHLGGNADVVIGLLSRHAKDPKELHVLDLACGKGAVSILLAKALGCHVTGVDLIPEFIVAAREKAQEHGVDGLCQFTMQDVNQAVLERTGFDCVIFSAAGDILGKPPEMLEKLKKTVRVDGFIILDESYLGGATNDDIQYRNYAYYTEDQWRKLFTIEHVYVVEKLLFEGTEMRGEMEEQLSHITKRVHELGAQYPDKKRLFEGYLESQQNECNDILDNLKNAVWMLQKKQPPVKV